MIRSMTAFANKEEDHGDVKISWEVRSVNHRYLDSSVYVPEGFFSQEIALKGLIRKKINRGKVDAKLVCKFQEEEQLDSVKFNQSNVKHLLDAQKELEEVAKQSSVEKVIPLSTIEILQFPGVMQNVEIEYTQFNQAIFKLLDEALDSLSENRGEEGERLKEMLLIRGKSVLHIVEQVKERRPLVIAALREKVLNKVSDLAIEVDNNRLEQELVIQAQRLDVDEELDRLGSHIEELFSVLERNEPVGRRLDFLMQELNREANTLGAKANDAETTKCSVELKVLIEQMREQVMNIE